MILIVPVTILSVIFFRLLYLRLSHRPATSSGPPPLQTRRSQLDALPPIEKESAEDDKDSYLQVLPDSDEVVYDQVEY